MFLQFSDYAAFVCNPLIVNRIFVGSITAGYLTVGYKKTYLK